MIPDDVYIQKAIAGDDEAFDALIKRHRRDIYTVAYRMLGNRRDAERITHVIFLEARNHIRAFRGYTKFGTWLYRIAKNLCLQNQQTKAQLGVR